MHQATETCCVTSSLDIYDRFVAIFEKIFNVPSTFLTQLSQQPLALFLNFKNSEKENVLLYPTIPNTTLCTAQRNGGRTKRTQRKSENLLFFVLSPFLWNLEFCIKPLFPRYWPNNLLGGCMGKRGLLHIWTKMTFLLLVDPWAMQSPKIQTPSLSAPFNLVTMATKSGVEPLNCEFWVAFYLK